MLYVNCFLRSSLAVTIDGIRQNNLGISSLAIFAVSLCVSSYNKYFNVKVKV